jgi:glycosyltransferase involved in cell wall biosynthesis
VVRPGRHVIFYDAYPHSYTGTARTVHLLAQHLPAHGWSTEVVLPDDGPVAEWVRASGTALTVVPTPERLRRYGGQTGVGALVDLPAYWRRLGRHLRARPGVVFVTSHRSVLLAGVAARLAGLPVLWQVSGLDEPRVLGATCELVASQTVAISPLARAWSLRPWREQAIVPPPLDPRFRSIARQAPTRPPVIVAVGRLDPVKGHRLLLDAFARVRECVPDVVLRIVGGDQVGHEAHGRALRRQIDGLPAGAVELVGWSDRPEQHVRGASVFVSAAPREGLGLAIAEAMACGVPAVVTSGTGLLPFVGPDAVVVVPPGDAAALAAGVLEVLRNPVHAERMARGGPTAVRSLDIDEVARLAAAALDGLVGPP